MITIAVLTGVNDDDALKAEKPDHIFDSVAKIPEVLTLNATKFSIV